MTGGIFTGAGRSIDSFVNTHVTSVSSDVAAAIAPTVAIGITLWVTLYGLAVIRQEVSEPLGMFIKNLLKFSLIMSFALGGGLYQSEIIGAIYGLQDGLVSAVTQPTGTTSIAGSNIYEVLDGLDEKGTELAFVMVGGGMSKLPVGGWLDLLAGVIVFSANTVLLILCGGYVLLAKASMAFVLSVGPLFIACLAFPPAAKFFDAWAGKVMNYVLLMVVLAFTVGLSIGISDAYAAKILISGQGPDPSNPLADAFSLATLYGVLILVIRQSPNIASGLAGGASLSGGGFGLFASAVAGRLAGRSGGSGGKSEGGSIEGAGQGSAKLGSDARSEGGAGSGGGPSAGTGRKPAYRKATMDNLNKR